MHKRDEIQGTVVGDNSVNYDGRVVDCFINAMQEAIAPVPLDLTPHMGAVVKITGMLRGAMWSAELVKEPPKEGYQEITGEVVDSNVIRGPGGPIVCYRHTMVAGWDRPLRLFEYMGETITVAGDLQGGTLYGASVVRGPDKTIDKDPSIEAKSLHDLLRIRADNRAAIEAVNGNLGTALGFKWSNGQNTNHPCVIIFVPQKAAPSLIPENNLAPEFLEADDGTWCLTDVVTGGKTASLEEIGPLPDLSPQNQEVVDDLKSGRVGLIGGIQLAFYGDGVRDRRHQFVGTAGVAVRHRNTRKVGFLTNQHVADAPGRKIYHPWHDQFYLGRTRSTKEYENDSEWYDGIIDESFSRVRCDCGFVEVSKALESSVSTGLHAIGRTGELLPIDPETMDIIGQRVVSVGRTRGVQRGTIVAYAYEYQDEGYSSYTDLLIIGENRAAFSWKGDSGKIIVTDDNDHRPVALLWGGWQERLAHGREQELWTYAIDLGKALDRLKLDLLE